MASATEQRKILQNKKYIFRQTDARAKGRAGNLWAAPLLPRTMSTMRIVIVLLALAGLVVSYLALRVHYSNDVQPCDINSRWDCGIVNHSPFAMIGPVPVAAIGIAGYALLGALALMRRRGLVLAASLIGLGFALYLTYIEKYVLMVWCLYCVISQAIILLLALLAAGWLWAARRSARLP
jgi:uncharacterized membrane protein